MFDLERLQKQSGIIGTSLGIRQVLEMIMQISPVDISVLVTGESGTGKEVVAKAIHKFSKRKNEEMVVVNCGAIPEGIIESELFGHKKVLLLEQVVIGKGILNRQTEVLFSWMK